jgi:hypothetical protein
MNFTHQMMEGFEFRPVQNNEQQTEEETEEVVDLTKYNDDIKNLDELLDVYTTLIDLCKERAKIEEQNKKMKF